MTDAEQLRHIARKLRTYTAIYTGDNEAREMAAWCDREADAREEDQSHAVQAS